MVVGFSVVELTKGGTTIRSSSFTWLSLHSVNSRNEIERLPAYSSRGIHRDLTRGPSSRPVGEEGTEWERSDEMGSAA